MLIRGKMYISLIYIGLILQLARSVEEIVQRADYQTYCLSPYRCMMTMTACYSFGWEREFTNGVCKPPKGQTCLDSASSNCYENSNCVLEQHFISMSSTDLHCKLPADDPAFNCATDCEPTLCKNLGYYNDNGTCVKLGNNPEIDCDGKPLCDQSLTVNQVCIDFGYINDADTYVCRKLKADDCLSELNFETYCKTATSYCQKTLGFKNENNKCIFDCLLGNNCKEETSFCMRGINGLGRFGFDQQNLQGKCYVKATLEECTKIVNECPLACISKYGFIISAEKCLYPLHSNCDQATEFTEIGCNSNKEICKKMGWLQYEKGSNKCADPIDTCLGQTDVCNVSDGNGTSLGEYLGLKMETDIGWVYPGIDDCILGLKNYCQRSASQCRKFGYKIVNSQCEEPSLLECKDSEKCSSKIETICKKKYGFVSGSSGNKCQIPTNCSSIKKLTTEHHACELNGYISLDNNQYFVDTIDFFNSQNMELDWNYEIILTHCLNKSVKSSLLSLCSSANSVCRLIGFKSNNGLCTYPQIEECIVAGSGMCSSNHICLRFYKLEKSSSSNDCVLPPDYTKCQDISDQSVSAGNHYCFLYFGYKSVSKREYCDGVGSETTICQILKNVCDVKGKNCVPTTFIGFNSYPFQKNPIFDTYFSICIGKSTTSALYQFCATHKFEIIDNKYSVPSTCEIEDKKQACLLGRLINPNKLASCIDADNCSEVCIYYGFEKDSSTSKCKLPEESYCENISPTIDIFYHACSFLQYGTDKQKISHYCLEEGKDRCSSGSICVQSDYQFVKNDSNNDCKLSDFSYCKTSTTASINCKIIFSFLFGLRQSFIPLENSILDYQFNGQQKGLSQELGMLFVSDEIQIPTPIDCLKEGSMLCKKPVRFGNTYPYQTYCQLMKFQSADDGSCLVDINECVKDGTTCTENQACLFSGFVESINDQSCLIMEKDKYYCHKSKIYSERQDYCEQIGYKWVTDHYELPTHEECEDNTNKYCSKGKITCTSRGWTAINENCVYSINCLDLNQNYCQMNESICYYLGYQLSFVIIDQSYQYNCIEKSGLKCSTKGQKNCKSKLYSICIQQGYTQDTNQDCKCDGVIYQDKCIVVKTDTKTSGSKDATNSPQLQSSTAKILLLIILLITLSS